MSRRVFNRKFVEKYYEIVDDQAICKLCMQRLKSNRNFNLKTHVIKVHKINENNFRNEIDMNTTSNIMKAKIRYHTVKIQISKKQLFRSYIGLVTEDSIPFNVLNSENFKNILNPICVGLSQKLG